MSATRRPVGQRALPMLLLAACLAAGAATATDIDYYEYHYDALPREHLGRFGRASEHVQHVPADAPRAPEAGDVGVVQRVPRRGRGAVSLHEDAAPEATTAEAATPEQEPPRTRAEPPAELQPPPRMEGAAEDLQAKQAPQVPAALSKSVKEDMETANFFWGMGPVYPHLYVYRRVPHLVPLHGWDPYHSYILTHPST